ncbi:unnamed protein product [Didymodactylos carnosus]|uniref:DDE Tnp4 domain-containing protein n=1 Tax=Didymodactylos carnosus TaxID=1234261 RepID=A0A8S2F6Y5_9BILA|nr:unnamed protein product [Didymodactylos carnosus]CAF4157083.1 unnamed protein product [Didymodactylos carnosus]
MHETCVGCNWRFDGKRKKRKVSYVLEQAFLSARYLKNVSLGSYMCDSKCRLEYLKWLKYNNELQCLLNEGAVMSDKMEVDEKEDEIITPVTVSVQTQVDLPSCQITIPIIRTSKSHWSCVVCGKTDPSVSKVLHDELRKLIFMKRSIMFTAEEANTTRCITKIRWVVESANGKIKQWAFFNKTIQNSTIAYLSDYTNIICGIINKYRTAAVLDRDKDSEYADKMLTRLKDTNKVKERLSRENLTHHSKWKDQDAQNYSFPQLTEQELRDITFGIFQVKQASSYVQEHLKPSAAFPQDFEFTIQTADNVDDLVKVRYQSRHSNSQIYNTYIEYNNGILNPISRWFCTCTAGERTVGCCSDIAATLWHLCLNQTAIHDVNQSPNNYLNLVEDALQFSDYENSSD